MRVFKYRGGPEEILRRDIRTLFENKVYAAPVESLNDLFEAQFKIHGHTFRLGHILSAVGIGTYTTDAKAAEDRFLSELESFTQRARAWGVYSLSRTPTDELLWAYYAHAHQGFCLEYELDELLAYKLDGQTWTTVDYQDEVPTITLTDVASMEEAWDRLIKKFIGTKSKHWQHEDEVRVIAGEPGLFEYDFRALKAVYFGARSTPQLRRRVMRAMAGRGIWYFEVKPSGQTYALTTAPISDTFARPTSYRRRIAPVDDGIPYWDEKTSPYRAELLRAIEIVRREPYCERVTDAYVSLKSTPDNPVFYVSYDRSDGLPRNFFITKKEVDAVV